MTTIVRNFNTDENFWETNPAFKSIAVFNDFYENDKSRKKKNSSKIMWAIAFLIDPHIDNPWKNLSEEDRKMLIEEDYIKDTKFKWSNYKEIMDEYYDRVLTLAEKDLYELLEKMHERAQFIKETPYALDRYEEDPKTGKWRTIKGNAKDLDKMVVDTAKLYEQLDLVKQKLEKEKLQSDGETKAGMQESATEKGLL